MVPVTLTALSVWVLWVAQLGAAYQFVPRISSLEQQPWNRRKRRCSAVTSFSHSDLSRRDASLLYMHMGHHDHHHVETPRGWQWMRRRRLIAMIVFCAVAILGPPLKHPFRSRLAAFFVTTSALVAAEPIRNYILSTIERIRLLGEGISKHSTPITASYLFQNKNAADRVTLLGGVINIVLSVSKFVVGVTCHSSALIADAGHSLSDLFSDFVTLWAVQVARLPPDQDHPYGHGKFEAVGSLFLSLTLIGTGIGVGVMANNKLLEIVALQRRGMTFAHQIPSFPALAMALISVVSKEWLFRVTRVVGQRLQSQVVIANAWHHRSDAYSSILATASIGLAMYVPGLLFVDAAAGLFVAAMIGMTGMEIMGESVKQLTDTSNEELVRKVTELANENADVESVVRVRARQVGSASSVDLSVSIPEDRTASAARAVEERLKQQILQYAGEDVVDIDVRATAPPNGTVLCSVLESRSQDGNPVSVEEIESCVRDEILRRHAESVSSIEGVTVHFRDAATGVVNVDVDLRLNAVTIAEAGLVARGIRRTLESSNQIDKARVFLELNDES